MVLKPRLRKGLLIFLLLVTVPVSTVNAAGPICVSAGGAVARWGLRVVGGVVIGVVGNVISDSMTGGGVHAHTYESAYPNNSYSNGEDVIPFEYASANTTIDDLMTELDDNGHATLRGECDKLGGVYPTDWSHIAESAFREDRVLFFHNYEAGSIYNGGGICLTS